MKDKLNDVPCINNNPLRPIPINPIHHLRHNSCNINTGNNDPIMKQLMTKPKAYERINSKEKDLFRTPSYRYGNDVKLKQSLMQKLPTAPKSIIISNELQYDSTSLNNHNTMTMTKTKGISDANFPMISQQLRTNTANGNNIKESIQFNKTTTAGMFSTGGTKIKKSQITKTTTITNGNGLNKGKRIEPLEENNESFLNEVVNILSHVDVPSKQKKEEQDNKNNDIDNDELTIETNIIKGDEEEADPRINFERINQLNKQRPLTSYGGLMARKRSLQNSLSRQQSSKTRSDQNNNNNNNIPSPYMNQNQENEIQNQNYPFNE